MDLNAYRILQASCLELQEAYYQALASRQRVTAAGLSVLLTERLERLNDGRFYAGSGDSGIGEDS